MGNPFKSNPERGVPITDGGKMAISSSKDDKTGAMCVRIDPTNPRIVYATLWEAYRNGHLCHPEEKDLECTNRLMVVILGNR
jgi:hypothetical protein